MNQEIKLKIISIKEDNSNNIYTQAELKYIEEIKRISMEEFDGSLWRRKNNTAAISQTTTYKEESSIENTPVIEPKIVKM